MPYFTGHIRTVPGFNSLVWGTVGPRTQHQIEGTLVLAEQLSAARRPTSQIFVTDVGELQKSVGIGTPRLTHNDGYWRFRGLAGIEVVEVGGAKPAAFLADRTRFGEKFACAFEEVSDLHGLFPFQLSPETIETYKKAVRDLRHFRSPSVVEITTRLMQRIGKLYLSLPEYKGGTEAAYDLYRNLALTTGSTLQKLLHASDFGRITQQLSAPYQNALILSVYVDMALYHNLRGTIPLLRKLYDGLWESVRVPTFAGAVIDGKEYWDLRFVAQALIDGSESNFDRWNPFEQAYAGLLIDDFKGIGNLKTLVEVLSREEIMLQAALIRAHAEWDFLTPDQQARDFSF